MTIRLDRAQLLRDFESVSPGLAARELIPQSTCLVFNEGRVWTFNDEIACSLPTKLQFNGAVKAKIVMDLLSKLQEDEIDVDVGDGEFQIRGKSKKAGFSMEAEVLLQIEAVETPSEWSDLPEHFAEAVSIVHSCASREASQFVLTCVHIHPEYVEACDRFQMARYPLVTGVDKSILIRADSLQQVVNLGMTQVSETDNWIHFRNEDDLIVSCRRYLDEYKDLTPYFTREGLTPVSLPGGLEEVVSRSQLFSVDNAAGDVLRVDLKSGAIVVEGRGPTGWYKERQKVAYTGQDLAFNISPKLLVEVTKKSTACGIAADRLCIDGGSYLYMTSTVVVEEEG